MGVQVLFYLPMEHSAERHEDQKTILLVAERATDLRFVSGFLLKDNFNVLTASTGEEGLEQSRDYKDEIHLLLSDFQMEGINGLGLAAQMSIERPHLKVLLMSDFRGGLLILNEGWHFLPKPFVSSQLTALVMTMICPEKVSRFKSGGVSSFEHAF